MGHTPKNKLPVMARVALFILFNSFSHFINAQVIYNGYASVTNLSGATYTIGNVNEANHAFAVNDKVIIMQMQDDIIGSNTTNVSTFGDLGASGIRKTGQWEVARIASLTRTSGVLKTVTFSSAPTNVFNTTANAAVQIITFRSLSAAAFTSSANITGLTWDGTTGLGGVIALDVQTVFTLGHTISANAIGFAGGVKNPTQFASTSCDNTYVTGIGDKYAGKGEGIYRVTNSNLNGARGHILSGGGGGTDENSGGGGGSNYAAGGEGGPGYNGTSTGCTPGVGGLGGIALSSFITASRIFMGGGGGGGHENNNVGTIGGRGGGIVLIKTGTLTTTGTCAAAITANGETAGTAGNDAAGGGGGGGSIIMQVQQFTVASTCSLSLSANGGSGGSINFGTAHGAGGGGGQGTIIYSAAQPTTNMNTSTNNGSGGCNNDSSPCNNVASSPTLAPGAGIKDNTSTPLPVELASFTAVHSGESSYLQWTTLTEHKNNYFEVERSGNGIDFEPVTKVRSKAAGGNSTTALKYSCYDNYPLWGINYYRLKQVDVDGSAEYHPIILLNQNHLLDQDNFVVYPNPSNGNLYLDITYSDVKDMTIRLNLLDVSGRQISSKSISNITTARQIELFNDLPKGYYILNVKTGYQDFNIKLTVN